MTDFFAKSLFLSIQTETQPRSFKTEMGPFFFLGVLKQQSSVCQVEMQQNMCFKTKT